MKSRVIKAAKKFGRKLGLGKLSLAVYNSLQEHPVGASAPGKKVEKASVKKEVKPVVQEQDTVMGVFSDSFGNKIEMLSGWRDRIKPGWHKMFAPAKAPAPLTPEACQTKLKVWEGNLARVSNYLRMFSLSLDEKDVLEIGAYGGVTAYALAKAGAKSVLATDMAAYYITQTPNGVVCGDAIAQKNAELSQLRESYSRSVEERIAQRVTFLEDDICASSIRPESVDVVVSWEVLEHVTKPGEAFANMARVLKPGGFAFHEYNPFFSIDGGHSLCTLDFPWGHARLQDADFERYLSEIRPDEHAVALSFYRNNLNRMTFSDLKGHARQAGLTIVDLLPWTLREHFAHLSPEALEQCRRVYPSVELFDLVSPFVWVLLRKDQ